MVNILCYKIFICEANTGEHLVLEIFISETNTSRYFTLKIFIFEANTGGKQTPVGISR